MRGVRRPGSQACESRRDTREDRSDVSDSETLAPDNVGVRVFLSGRWFNLLLTFNDLLARGDDMNLPVVALLMAASMTGQTSYRSSSPTPAKELDYQQQIFKRWWGNDLTETLADLPVEGKTADTRIPYAGHDYPDRAGGTVNALSKYDRAFNNGRTLATDFERRDVTQGKEPKMVRGLFGRMRRVGPPQVPSWYGHCNGWTAASIRHAEPEKSVVRNGVTFTPADIKGMLAEVYMYTETEFLGGNDPAIHPALFHLTMTNWVGRGSYPIGMEAALGEVVINYPVFSYKSTIRKLSDHQHEVQLTLTYVVNTPREYEKGPDFKRTMFFHYRLDTDDAGKIVGGAYYGDSRQVDMLWAPLKPIQGGEKGNERGNPHLNVKEVLAIWRESVSDEVRKQWLNIDPTDEDRIETAEAPAAPEVKPADAPMAAAPTPPAGNSPVAGPATNEAATSPAVSAPATRPMPPTPPDE